MTELKYRGRLVTTEEILYIRELITAHPLASRRRLSQKLCEAWQWKQANGALRDMVCRGLLLMLDRAGHIELPAVKCVPHNPLVASGLSRCSSTLRQLMVPCRRSARWRSSRCAARMTSLSSTA